MASDNNAIDVEWLREKYRVEAQKRLRADGVAQYNELKGAFASFDHDPFVEPGFTRLPVIDDTDVVIVGAGFGGMMTAAHLHRAGIVDFRMIDKAGDLGGTWYWNRYPGCMCDVEAYCYMPLLEEMGYMPKHKYAYASEIFEYCQALGRRFGMYDGALFQTEVIDLVWDESRQRWMVTTSRNDRLAARFVVIAGGVLHKAKLPGIPGIGDFKGRAFHTSRWDYSYTGGSPKTPMDKLGDKRVGIIGTGATAVQAVPELAKTCQELFVFQRTPSAINPRGQRATDPDWFGAMSSQPGWQQARIENFSAMTTGHNPAVDLVQDGWTHLLATDTRKPPHDDAEAAELELIDFRNMNEVRSRVDEFVSDPVTAESLKPWYKQSCKRPCFHDDYLPAFNRQNVNLVDTDGAGIERITDGGVVVGGVEYRLDCLVFASGFELTTEYTHRLGFDPKGAGGVSLSQMWSEGAYTLHGVHAHGFPNLLINSTIQGGRDINLTYSITATAEHSAHTIARCLNEDIKEIEPSIDAENEWFAVIMATVAGYGSYYATCTPGYLNNENSRPGSFANRGGVFNGSTLDFVKLLEAWRKDGSMAGLIARH